MEAARFSATINQGDIMAFDLSSTQVEKLLGSLSSDKAFYESFVSNPEAALKSLGLPTTLAACVSGKKILSMQEIATAKTELSTYLASTFQTTQHIHNLAAR
jgi:putative modified peptide